MSVVLYYYIPLVIIDLENTLHLDNLETLNLNAIYSRCEFQCPAEREMAVAMVRLQSPRSCQYGKPHFTIIIFSFLFNLKLVGTWPTIKYTSRTGSEINPNFDSSTKGCYCAPCMLLVTCILFLPYLLYRHLRQEKQTEQYLRGLSLIHI